jgi:hypothetical protein
MTPIYRILLVCTDRAIESVATSIIECVSAADADAVLAAAAATSAGYFTITAVRLY